MEKTEFFKNSVTLVAARLFALSLNLLIIPIFVSDVGKEVFVEWEKIVALSRIVTITNSAFTATVLWQYVNYDNLYQTILKFTSLFLMLLIIGSKIILSFFINRLNMS